MIELVLKALIAYLLGSVIGSLLIRRITGGVDIRTLGSGNAGATNALRTLGGGVAIWVLVIDIAKGWIATARLAPWAIPGIPHAPPEIAVWILPMCAIAVMLGHVYPVWYGFRGGKGVATLIGVVLGISVWLLIPMILAWLIAGILSGYVSLASMVAAIALAISLWNRKAGTPLIVFGIVAAVLILYTHRSNIARIRAGSESRARRLWLLGTRREQQATGEPHG
jgi:acyl phosphate:glycerol-3-phosphate acyltransferase